MKKVFSFIWEISKVAIIAALIVIPVRHFVFQPFVVRGQSMAPNLAEGDYLIVDELTYQFRGPERGEVVVFKSPEDPSQRFIKRVVGLPGETVEIKNNKVAIYGKEKSAVLDESEYLPSSVGTIGDATFELEKDEYFVLGDNRDFSYDSRRFGVILEDNIIGRFFFRVWGRAPMTKFEQPDY